MKLTKYGHCCLLLETKGKRILTDPGVLSSGLEKLSNIDVVIITHEHPDHLHTDSLQTVFANNPEARVICNASVGKILSELNISFVTVENMEAKEVEGIIFKAYEGPHAEIIDDFGLVQNTGFLVNNYFFYPGDSYTKPSEEVNVLAVPVAGPWCRVADAIHYALMVRPKRVIPVHDGLLNEAGRRITYPHFKRELTEKNIEFITLEDQQAYDL